MTIQKKSYRIKSPAKINIGLRILSKRKDGYHNLETIFFPIEVFDNLNVKITPAKDEFKITVKTVFKNKKIKQNLNNENNICYKSAKLFLERFKIKEFCKIHVDITKNIPTGAGLGGGSSNAASVLLVLAKHFLGKSEKTTAMMPAINKLALDLGSDVPFFLLNKPAYATGRGEKLIPLPKFKINYDILLALPGIKISTSWAFAQLKRQKIKGKKLNAIKSFKLSDKDKFVNDFEAPVFKKYPAISAIKRKMYNSGAVFASMTGSGSAVYGFYKKILPLPKLLST